ncbi:MAG: 4-hydroxy-tetrahydrodipicolinate synthase [Nitrospinae bacterium RIFCSPLOWO2_12_FULL_45_22]|nr:MAG: 4-hydroxy-tetrahydrodipicolinate synthase [Nitrospinae bacterium RIFCSPLOWO2_12_FULL_45_22]
MFTGSIVALVTPFRDGRVDEKGLRELIEYQMDNGTNGIVPCGTTGESATLSHKEHQHLVEITVDAVRKLVPVIAGTGSNSTEEAVSLTQHALVAGADASLMITPYYNKPTQEGLYQHFCKVASEVEIPIILYNVPSRTGVNLLPSTVARLAKIGNIVGIKEASGSLQQIIDIIALCGEDFIVLSGDDFLVLPILAVGGKGVISVVANVAPRDMAELVRAFQGGNLARAKALQYKLRPLNDAMFLETNPIPVKTALALMGKISGELRLPLCSMAEPNLNRLQATLKEYGVLA